MYNMLNVLTGLSHNQSEIVYCKQKIKKKFSAATKRNKFLLLDIFMIDGLVIKLARKVFQIKFQLKFGVHNRMLWLWQPNI